MTKKHALSDKGARRRGHKNSLKLPQEKIETSLKGELNHFNSNLNPKLQT